MKYLFRHWLKDKDGEPNFWWSWQDLRGRYGERKGPKPTGFCTNGRAWLYVGRQSFGVQWVLFSKRFAADIDFSTTDDNHISFSIGIPFVLSLYFNIGRAGWVKKLPGVQWRDGDYSSGDRNIGFFWLENGLYWRLWRNPGESKARDWRDSSFHIDDFLFGRAEYLETHRQRHNETVELPEGKYPVAVDLYTAVWLRPRWPWPKRVKRANVEIERGIPVPGDGENDWDCDDDAVYEITCPASTVEEAIETLLKSVWRDRDYDPEWRPEKDNV